MSTLINESIVRHSRGTASAWTSANPVLAQAEWGYETDTGNAKIGDGTTAWTSLLYSVYGDITAQLAAKITGGTTQICKAWVNFDGTGTVAIRSDYNVSSITDHNTGDYTVNFTTALSTTNYSVSASCEQSSGHTRTIGYNENNPSKTTAGIRLLATQVATATQEPVDIEFANIQIFET